MDLRQLRYFVGIVEAGSMTAAAERLHVAQSALSQHVKQLEERLGVRLLLRQPTGVKPTPAGLKLLQHARRILLQVTLAESEVRIQGRRPAGSVTIGIPAGVGRVLNTALIDAARSSLPDISVQIVEVLPPQVLEWVDSNRVQLGVYYELGPSVRDATQLVREDYYLVSGTEEPTAGSGVSLQGLANFPLIMPTCIGRPRHCIVVYAQQCGIELNVESRVDSLATILDLTINQPGRSVLSPAAFLPEWQAGKVFAYPLEPRISRTVHLAVAPTARSDPATLAVEALVSRVAATLQSHDAWPQGLPSRPH